MGELVDEVRMPLVTHFGEKKNLPKSFEIKNQK